MLLDYKKKKEYYDLGKEDNDIEEKNNKNLELTLIEKITINNIISISLDIKANNIVNILIKDEQSKKVLKKENNVAYNIVIDFSSDRESKNFFISFKSLIALYKTNLKNK